ncbi:MAG: ABC transporter permease subunit [Verrucomicrobiales bacterium]|nr:ABC transporter permease subunit [Verrucomicrobiales bacterium]
MNLFPVAHRELRVAARKRATYWVRFTAAALAMGTATLAFLATYRETPAAQAQALFIGLSVVAFVFCLFGGVAATSDCVSEEKRDGTLGLLFLTDLRPFDVVLGKMMAGSLKAVLALVALIPIIAIPILMGGVTADSVRQIAFTLLNTLFLSLALGVFVSVLARDARGALSGSLIGLLVLLLLLPALRWVTLDYLLPPPPPGIPTPGNLVDQRLAWMLLVNPAILLFTSFTNVFGVGRPGNDFWICLGSQHALAWLLLAAACVILPRAWQDRVERRVTPASPPRRSPPSTTEVRSEAAPPDPAWATRSRTFDREPFAWMITRESRPVLGTWIGLAMLGALWCWGFVEMKGEWLQAPIGITTLFLAGLFLKLRMANTACRPLHDHRRTGALELLLATPLQPHRIVRGLIHGLWSTFAPPVALLLLISFPLVMNSVRYSFSTPDTVEILSTFAVVLGILVLDLIALAWTGAWHGLRSQRYVRAVTLSVLQILVLPWVLFLVSLILTGIAVETLNLGGSFDFGAVGILAWWAFLAVAVDVWLIVRSARGLRTRFQELATGRYDSPVMPPTPNQNAAAAPASPAA